MSKLDPDSLSSVSSKIKEKEDEGETKDRFVEEENVPVNPSMM
jgi:hypothetical protein